MDKETSDKLNDTLGKMGAIDNGSQASSGNSSSQTSDMSFYVFMLAIIVGMAFYISYDMKQRYGTTSSTSITAEPSAAQEPSVAQEPVVVSVETVKTVAVQPVADVPVTETTPEAVVVEKVEHATVVTTAVVPVVEAKEALVKDAPKATPVKEAAAATDSQAHAMPMIETMAKSVDVITAPVVETVEVIKEAVSPKQAVKQEAVKKETPKQALKQVPVARQAAAPAYNNYANPYQGYQPQYGNPYQGGYQQQPQQQYGNPYANPYANPYGYGNPYQQQ